MKQTTKKMFTGCPYERLEEITCSQCSNYQKCHAKKQARRRKRRKTAIKRLAAFLVCIVCGLVFYLRFSINANSNQEDGETTETTTTTESKTTSSSTSTSISTTIKPVPNQEPKISAYGPSEDYYYNISYEDKVLIAKVVYAEARGESYEGQVAVAAVILNRYFNGEGQAFKRSSIEAVVKQPYQFASIKNVTMEKLEAYPQCFEAVEDACKGWDPTRKVFEEGAFFFYNPKGVTGKQAEIRKGIKVMVIGDHNFHVDFEKVK